MKNLWGSLALVLLGLIMSRCSGPKVIAFIGNDPDFGTYYTYRVQHPSEPEAGDENFEAAIIKIEDAIGRPMMDRGYEPAEVSDIVVTYNLILDNKTDYRVDNMNRYNRYNQYSYYQNPYSYPYWFERDDYTEGTLLVELREGLSNKLIWQGSLDMKYNKSSSSKKKKRNDPVENAFEMIFAEYYYVAGNSEPQTPKEE
jgi:hypothetical protein